MYFILDIVYLHPDIEIDSKGTHRDVISILNVCKSTIEIVD